MKYFSVLSFTLVLLIFTGCRQADQITEPVDQSISSLQKKGGKKPTPTQRPLINLSIGIIDLITDSEIVSENQDALILLGGVNKPDISYSVSSPDMTIDNVEINIYYDANVDYLIHWNREVAGKILVDNFPGQTYKESGGIDDWDGMLQPIAYNDPTYTGDFQLTDQSATEVNHSTSSTADHFRIAILVSGSGFYEHLRSYIWIENSIQPAGTFHVDQICYNGATKVGGNRYTAEWKVLITDEHGGPVQGASVYIYYNEDPDANIGRALFEVSDVSGWAIVSNGGFNRKDFGAMKITIAAVQKFNGAGLPMMVYDPVNNNSVWGSWPDNKPNMTIQFPDELPNCP